MLETFRQEDADALKRVEAVIVQAVLPYRQTISPMLVAMALVRCARTVLRLCNKNDQQELLPVLIAFLQGKVNPPKGEGSVLWTPDSPGPM